MFCRPVLWLFPSLLLLLLLWWISSLFVASSLSFSYCTWGVLPARMSPFEGYMVAAATLMNARHMIHPTPAGYWEYLVAGIPSLAVR
eukprot:jgi/Bigna1/58834/fgenesh1_kg.1_\